MDRTTRSEAATLNPPGTTPAPLVLLQACRLRRLADDRRLLDDVSLEAGCGDRVAVVGPTGSGKTLLLRAMALLDPLDAGHILWNGSKVRRDDVPHFRSRIIYLQQRPALAEGTVEENLRQPFSLRVHRERRYDPDVHRARLASLGRDESFLGKQQRDLSGGEAQIVALLRAMQLDPEVLLLDEPTSALDSHASHAIEQIVADWFNEVPGRRATVWVTHDHEQAHRVATRVLEMGNGVLRRRRPT